MAWTQRVEDTFTDDNFTALEDHTPDQGGAWVQETGGHFLFSGSLSNGTGGAVSRNAQAVEDKQAAEGTVVNSPQPSGPAVRLQSGAASGYYVSSRGNPFNDRRIIRLDAGTPTLLESDGNFHSNGDVIRLEADGSTITAYLNGGTPLVATDSTYGSGYVGVAEGDVASFLLDNFKGYDEAGGGGEEATGITARIFIGL